VKADVGTKRKGGIGGGWAIPRCVILWGLGGTASGDFGRDKLAIGGFCELDLALDMVSQRRWSDKLKTT